MSNKPSPSFGTIITDEFYIGETTNDSSVSLNARTSGENLYDSRILFSGGKNSSNSSSNFNIPNSYSVGSTSILIDGQVSLTSGLNGELDIENDSYDISSISSTQTVLTTIILSNKVTLSSFDIISIYNQTNQQTYSYPLYSNVSDSNTIVVIGEISYSTDVIYTVTDKNNGIPTNTIISSVSFSNTEFSTVVLSSGITKAVTIGQSCTVTITDPNSSGFGSVEIDCTSFEISGSGDSTILLNVNNITSGAEVDLSTSNQILIPTPSTTSNIKSPVNIDFLTANYASQSYVETQVENIVTTVAACSYPSIPPEERTPGIYDDETKGYEIGDYWYYNNSLWRATSVESNSATWGEVSVTKLPGDIFGSNTLFAGGPSQLVSGYTGPCIDIQTTVTSTTNDVTSTSNITTTIDITSSGNFDMDTFLSTISGVDDGSYIIVTKIYDQTGNNNHLVTTSSNSVHIGVVYLNGLPTISWGYRNGNTTAGGFEFPSTMKTPGNSFFFGTLGQNIDCNCGNVSSCPILLGNSWDNEVKFLTGYYQMDGYIHILENNASEFDMNLSIRSEPSPFCFYTTSSGYGATTLTDSGNTAATLPSVTYSGGYLGYNATYNQNNTETGANYYTTSVCAGTYSGIILANVTPSQSQIDAYIQSGIVYGKYKPQSRNQVVVVGDSRSAGYETFDNNPWPSLLQRYKSSKLYNFSVSGATTVNYKSYLPAIQNLRKYSNNIAIVWGGINDISVGNSTVSIVENIQYLVKELQSYGFKVYVISEMENNNHASEIRGPLENALANGIIPFDGWIDPFNQGNVMNETSSSDNFYTDYTHPTNKGHRVLASQIWHEIKDNFV